MSTKICRCCKKEKLIEEFVKDNRSKDGYSTQCKECKKIESNERYNRLKNDPEFRKKHNESNRKSKLKNKEHVDEYNAEYRMRPEVIERMQKYHQERNKKSDLITRYRDIEIWFIDVKLELEKKQFHVQLNEPIFKQFIPIYALY